MGCPRAGGNGRGRPGGVGARAGRQARRPRIHGLRRRNDGVAFGCLGNAPSLGEGAKGTRTGRRPEGQTQGDRRPLHDEDARGHAPPATGPRADPPAARSPRCRHAQEDGGLDGREPQGHRGRAPAASNRTAQAACRATSRQPGPGRQGGSRRPRAQRRPEREDQADPRRAGQEGTRVVQRGGRPGRNAREVRIAAQRDRTEAHGRAHRRAKREIREA